MSFHLSRKKITGGSKDSLSWRKQETSCSNVSNVGKFALSRSVATYFDINSADQLITDLSRLDYLDSQRTLGNLNSIWLLKTSLQCGKCCF